MRKIILVVTVLFAMALQANAQTTLKLNINHKLGDEDFNMGQTAKNNLEQDFLVTRLEYYISEISIVHDGGKRLLIEDLWILANASESTIEELGNFDVSEVEGIEFHIGVDPEHNHLDPASFGFLHPLSPKFPSMHWGWSAGYRFVAMEGEAGRLLNQEFQLHALGDDNYFKTRLDLDLVAVNNEINIIIDADYTRALENIEVASGIIVHGDNLGAQQCLENFRDFVFSTSNITSSIDEYNGVSEFKVFPNPVSNGISSIILKLEDSDNEYSLSVTAIDGKQLQLLNDVFDGQTIDFSNQTAGIYFVNLIKEGQKIITRQILVK